MHMRNQKYYILIKIYYSNIYSKNYNDFEKFNLKWYDFEKIILLKRLSN